MLPPAFVFIAIPLLDCAVGTSHGAPESRLDAAARRRLARRPAFRAAVLLWPLLQLSMLAWGSARVGAGRGGAVRDAALALSLGLTAAGGINCAHELLHRRGVVERGAARLLLISVCYGHFFIEHSRGHHRTVATPDDPATLAFGESFYQFLPRTVFGGFCSAWRLEGARLRAERHAVWGPRNAMLWYVTLPFVLFIAPLYAVYGVRALALFFTQAGIAIALLEQINAMEHYGLVRRRRPSGEYEPVGPQHSWDAPHVVSNYLLFKLQRHADHHLHVGKHYEALELTPESPQLPGGYLTLAPCLLVPPLWRAVMDPVLAKYQKQRTEELLYSDSGGR